LDVIGRNSIVKYLENFSERNAKFLPENFLPLPRNRKNRKYFTCSNSVNVHVYSRSQIPSNFLWI